MDDNPKKIPEMAWPMIIIYTHGSSEISIVS